MLYGSTMLPFSRFTKIKANKSGLGKVSLTALFVLMLHLGLQGQAWELKKSESGIKVYTRDVKGSDLDAFKGICTIDAPLEEVVKRLKDPNSFCDWMPRCAQSKVMKIQGEDIYYYYESEAPFPLDNRDCYYHYSFEAAPKRMSIFIEGIPDYAPPQEGKVRIPMVKGYWLLEDIGNGRTQIVYEVQANPGGSIPAWLANAGSVDLPYNTLYNLREQLN